MREGAGQRWASLEGGATLEALVVLTLLLLILTVGSRTFTAHTEAARRTLDGAMALEATRLSRWVLGTELRAGLEGRDWRIAGDGALYARIFRGVAVPCGTPGPGGEIQVRRRGLRNPDPAKDSILVLGPDGGWRAHALLDREPGGDGSGVDCPAPENWRWERWRISGDGGPWLLARYFESGSYHLADGALRYLRGGAGRQPLVPEVFGSASALEPVPGGIRVEIEVVGGVVGTGADPQVQRWTVRSPGG